MLKIGLTGGIASGKTTVCQLFKQFDITIVDADILARELVEIKQPALIEIIERFGSTLLHADGSLNRAELRTLIFSDPQAKQDLEAILHPRIHQQLQIQSEQAQSDYCILAIPLLIEANFQHSIDRLLLIDIEVEQQLKRLCLRDSLVESEAMKIINNQCNRQQRLDVADDIIFNNQSIIHLNKAVEELDQKYRILAKEKTPN